MIDRAGPTPSPRHRLLDAGARDASMSVVIPEASMTISSRCGAQSARPKSRSFSRAVGSTTLLAQEPAPTLSTLTSFGSSPKCNLALATASIVGLFAQIPMKSNVQRGDKQRTPRRAAVAVVLVQG